MPGQRGKGQSFIGCHLDAEFSAEIDRARGGRSRSDFLRDAIYQYLASLGYRLPPAVKYAPDRKGKGGRPKKDAAARKGFDPLVVNEEAAGYRTKPPPRKKA